MDSGRLLAVVAVAVFVGVGMSAAPARGEEESRSPKDKKKHVQAPTDVKECFKAWCPSGIPGCKSFHCGGLAIYVHLEDLEATVDDAAELWAEFPADKMASCILWSAPDGAEDTSDVRVSLAIAPRRPVKFAKMELNARFSTSRATAAWPKWRPRMEKCVRGVLAEPLAARPRQARSAVLKLLITPSKPIPLQPTREHLGYPGRAQEDEHVRPDRRTNA